MIMKKHGFTLIGTLMAMLIISVLALAVLGILSNQNFLTTMLKGKYEMEGDALKNAVEWFLINLGPANTVAEDVIDDVTIKLVGRTIERSTQRTLPRVVIRFEAE